MRLPDPTTSPAGLGFTDYSLSSNNQTMATDTNSGETISVQVAGHTWQLNINFPESIKDSSSSIITRTFLHSLRGRFFEADVVLPDKTKPRYASFPDTTSASIPNGQTGSTVTINNWDLVIADTQNFIGSNANILTGYLEPDDLIQFSNSTKVYIVTSASYNASTGQLQVNIFPNLVVPTNSSQVILNNVTFTGKLVEDTIQFSLGLNKIQPSFSIDLKESY